MADTADTQLRSMLRNLEEKTGKTAAQWIKLIGKSGLTKHGEIVKFLKTEHGLTHGYANLLSTLAREQQAGGPVSGSELLDAQYAGAKAALKPIYEKIASAVAKFGSDVELAPKKTYVSLRRKKQFGLVQPSTKDRVDVGLVLKGTAPTGRLEASGSFNAMVTHRVRLSSAKDVNKELVGWLKQAYEQA